MKALSGDGFIIQPRAIIRRLQARFDKSDQRNYNPLLLYSLIRAYYASRWEGDLFWTAPRGRTLREFADLLGCDLRTIRGSRKKSGSWRDLIAWKLIERPEDPPDALNAVHDEERVQYLPKDATVWQLVEVDETDDGIMDKYEAAILSRRDLSDLAKVLFIIISSLHNSGGKLNERCKTGEWYATVLGAHRSKIIRALAQLRDINAVKITARRREHDHYKAANLIEPLPSSSWLPDRKRQKGVMNNVSSCNDISRHTKGGHESIQKGVTNSAKGGHENVQKGVDSEVRTPEALAPEVYASVAHGVVTDAARVLSNKELETQAQAEQTQAAEPLGAANEPISQPMPILRKPEPRNREHDLSLLAQYGAQMHLLERQLMARAGRAEPSYSLVPDAECEDLMNRISAIYRGWLSQQPLQQRRSIHG